jgi:hypothetical protein
MQCANAFYCSPTFVGSPRPYLANTTLPDGDGTILSMAALPADLPMGTYVFYAVPVPAGKNIMDSRTWVGTLASEGLMLTR